MATATRKRTSKKSANKAQSTIVKLNSEALKTTKDLIEGTIETGAKWQNLYAKSLKSSEPIISKNIDIAFDSIETVVEQYQKGSKRVLALFGWDVKEVKKATKKVVSATKKAVKPTTKKATATIKKATSTANKTAKKVAATAKTEVKATTKAVVSKAKKVESKVSTTAKKTAKTVAKKAPKVDVKNLKLIHGIGPKMEELLKKEGYPDLESISKATVADLKKVLDTADSRYRLLNPESWVSDAKKALK